MSAFDDFTVEHVACQAEEAVASMVEARGGGTAEYNEVIRHLAAGLEDEEPETYLVRRACFDESDPDHGRVIRTGLTLEEAQEHCSREDTRGDGWFDGYMREAR